MAAYYTEKELKWLEQADHARAENAKVIEGVVSHPGLSKLTALPILSDASDKREVQ